MPLDLRRTTLVVGDMERSLAFYRDALGMAVIYDNLLLRPAEAASLDEAERGLRLVFLRANDDFIGVLGLMEYLKPRKDVVDLAGRAFDTGTSVLVFNVADQGRAFEAASALEGVEVLSEPVERQYPVLLGRRHDPGHGQRAAGSGRFRDRTQPAAGSPALSSAVRGGQLRHRGPQGRESLLR